jgi:NodT family efflux transporter outer membrane factor (OMF) lipoprotein
MAALAIGAAAVLCACATVGPTYDGPPQVARDAVRRGRFVRAEDIFDSGVPQTAWWQAFEDPALDVLVERALAVNLEIAGARARLLAARAALGEQRAQQGPGGAVQGAYARVRPSFIPFGVSLPGVQFRDFDLYQTDVDASWELDLVGRHRRTVEAATAQVDAWSASLDDVRLAIAAETARAYLELRCQQSRLEMLTRAVQLDASRRHLVELRLAEGTGSALDLERLREEQDMTSGEIPGVLGAITVQLDRLARLTGGEPGALDDALGTARGVPPPPAKVSVGDPAQLIRRRPDVRAAERNLAADTALVGVATADLFPKVTLTGNIGMAANDVGGGAAGLYSIGPSISWGIFDLRRVRARIDEAGARRDEALAYYQEAVLAALNDAESALTGYARRMETVAARRRNLQSAEREEGLAAQRFHEGVANSLEVADAARHRLTAEERLLSARADLSLAYVALETSLGLAWANSDPRPRRDE